MGHLLIQKDDVWNIWSTVVDAPLYERGLTRAELAEEIRQEHGNAGVRELGPRIERALKTGCSHAAGWTLMECIEFNRAGPNESCLPADELIRQYLSAPEPERRAQEEPGEPQNTPATKNKPA